MTVKCIILFCFAYFKMTKAQYYGLPAPSYQPYNYWSHNQVPVESQPFAPAQVYPSASMYPPSMFVPTYSQLPYMFASTSQVPPGYTFPLAPIFSPAPTYPAAPTTPAPPSLSGLSSYNPAKYTPVSAAPKCNPNPPTATAYYLTTAEAPKASAIKNIIKEVLPPPTYPCPFCKGFADVPKNSKVAPPPPCGSVLPGILDKIPTINLPDELKINDLKIITPPSIPLFSDFLEKKLAKKLRFDQDVLDGFLTGLGLGK